MATTPPSSDPQATQADTVIVGSVNQAVLQQANPEVARAYTSDFVAAKNEIIATQVKQLEATQGFPVTDAQLTGITVSADAPARFIVNSKYQNEIEAANAAQSVPADTPPPTVAPADIDAPTPAAEFGSDVDFLGTKRSAADVSGDSDPFAGLIDDLIGSRSVRVNPKTTISPQQAASDRAKAAKEQAKQQDIINQQRKQANDGDWRVRLRLAGNSNYLYNAPNPGILQPLEVTDGVIFPYTPQITTAYQAKYNAYELTHSNYKGYFYQGSSVGDISINATFTAQDTDEANYLLAVIHFFRSVTKMFYGKDDSALRGAPPPLVFLQGLGEYQFNLHPCVVSNFNYTLPADVDYIRALSPNNSGTNLIDRRSLQSGVTPFVNPSVSRLRNAGLPQGGISTPPAPPTLGTNSPTYVPTKMDIQLTLLAIQTRSQVSKQFSLKEFANGDLIKGGFW